MHIKAKLHKRKQVTNELTKKSTSASPDPQSPSKSAYAAILTNIGASPCFQEPNLFLVLKNQFIGLALVFTL